MKRSSQRSWQALMCRRSRAFRVISSLFLAYLLIGALHGMVPQLWAKHAAHPQDNGPFRVLLFTTVMLAAVLCLLTHGRVRLFGLLSQVQHIPSMSAWATPLLRAPPAV